MTPDDTRNWVQQEDDGWSRAMELALTPVVAGGIGYIVDRVAGTVPVFTIVFFALAVVGTFVKMYYAYDAKMKAHDAESPWGRAQAHAADLAAADLAGADRTAADLGAADLAGADAAAAGEGATDRAANRGPAHQGPANRRPANRRPARNAAADHAAADRAAADHAAHHGADRP